MTDASFQTRYRQALGDPDLQEGLSRSLNLLLAMRARTVAGIPQWEEWRLQGERVKDRVLNRLDFYLEKLETAFTRQGGFFYWAEDGDAACRYILRLARRHNVRLVVKGKSMISEEIGLNEALSAQGVEPVETDLGEFFVQLAGEKPSHILAPAIHQTRYRMRDLLSRKGRDLSSPDPEAITREARAYLRSRFLQADLGITGANFVVAETGTVVLFENEGNIRFSTTLPPLVVTVVSMEKVVPDWGALHPLIHLLSVSATGQWLPTYLSFLNPPLGNGAEAGPREHHLVVLDNGRTGILGDPRYRTILRCLRCAACLNVCPVYQKIGGHPYGSVYPGPMGSVLSPLLFGLEAHEDLPFACTLCGACAEICPVRINLPDMLLQLREQVVRQWEKRARRSGMRWGMTLWSRCAGNEGVLAVASRAIRVAGPVLERLPVFRAFPSDSKPFSCR